VVEQDPGQVLVVEASRPHRAGFLVRFQGVSDRDGAEALRGRYLFVDAAASPDLPEGAFWAHRLVGARVTTESGRALGAVREVVHTRANDLWVAVDEAGAETFVPALKDVVADVDLDAGTITVRDVPGITSPAE